MASKSQDAEKAVSGSVSKPSPFQSLRRRMADMAILEQSQGRTSGEDINAILTAETEAEMWDADELAVFNAQKLSGTDLQVTGFEVRFGGNDSEIETPFTDAKGRQMYLLVTAFRLTDRQEHKEYILPAVGEEFTWNTSARNIVGKLFWMLDHGWFDPTSDHGPVQFQIKGTKLTGGRSVEKIKEIEGGPITLTVQPSF